MAPERSPELDNRSERTGDDGVGALPEPSGAPASAGWPGWFRRSTLRSLAQVVDPAHSARMVDQLVAVEMPALLVMLAHDYATNHLAGVIPLVCQEVILLVVLLLNRRGCLTATGALFCVSNWALVSWFLFTGGTELRHSALLGYPAVLLIASLLLNLRLLVAITLLVLTTVVALAVCEVEGWIRHGDAVWHNYGQMFDPLVVLGFTVVATFLFTRDIRAALLRAGEQERKLGARTAELRRQTDVLQGTARKLQTAMELAVEGVAHADAANRITDANTRAGEISGYSREELVGRPITDFFAESELDRCPARWDLLARGEAVIAERTLLRKDGSTTLVETTSRRLPDGTLQCFVRDVAQRRIQEDASRQRQRLEALGTLAGGVAHDFNNLLTVMHGSVDALTNTVSIPASAASPMQDLRTAVDHAKDLTRQLLAFARRQTLDRRQIDLRATLERNIRMLRRLLDPKIDLVLVPAVETCPVFADAGALAQVFTNLAVNARDAMPKGGQLVFDCRVVDLTAPRPRAEREILPGRYVCVHVRDTGIGMTEEVKRKLFEPFYTTKGQEQGTGLGLSVSLGIVEQHGGWIEVSSEVGEGSEFRVYLPRQEVTGPAITAAAPAPAPARTVRGTETILLVEDEEPVRRLAVHALEWCGFKVLEAEDGEAALKLWEVHGAAIALLLTDVAMPGALNGVDLVRACRARRPQLPVLITSGHHQEDVSLDDDSWDDIRFLPKPYTMTALAAAARETIDTPVPSPEEPVS